jgi:formylglycine-generating enzyme required for sulfatase activity
MNGGATMAFWDRFLESKEKDSEPAHPEVKQEAMISKPKTLESRREATSREGAKEQTDLARKTAPVKHRQPDVEAPSAVSKTRSASRSDAGSKSTVPVPKSSNQRTLSRELVLDLDKGVKMELVLVPAGTFLMGSPHGEDGRTEDEEPRHEAVITRPFYIGKYAITQAEWQAMMGSAPSFFKGDNRPVENVSWDDCQAFCGALSQKTGRVVRLPTEAEWEYSCRAGTGTAYSFGDSSERLGGYAWYGDNSGSETQPVGGKQPNSWGLHDMHGNVWEWCSDWYDETFYVRSPKLAPRGASSGNYRVLRGGSWLYYPWGCRSAVRLRYLPACRSCLVGLRVVVLGLTRGTSE